MNVPQGARPLRRVLGLGFGLAIAFGGTVGVGILRLPGTLASTVPDSFLLLLLWLLGAIWALLGAAHIAELAALFPEAGGFYVYARRAFGNAAGFVVGWSDWANMVAAIAYVGLAAIEFLARLWPAAASAPRPLAIALIVIFACVHWTGLRPGSLVTRIISATVGGMLLALVVGCFWVAPAATSLPVVSAPAAVSLPLLSITMLAAFAHALRMVFVSFDGWYSPIYMAEESIEPSRTLPRVLIGGTVLVAVLYLLINMAILRVLPINTLAASKLPAADAAQLILPVGGAEVVTVISLLTLISSINAFLLMSPRVLVGIGRSGFFTEKAALVGESGTPRLALAVTTIGAIVLILSGTFETILAIAAVLFLLNYLSAYAAVIVLRRRSPELPRPYRAFGFPVTTVILLAGCLLLWLAVIAEDTRAALLAGCFLVACAPLYALLARRRRVVASEGRCRLR